MYKYKNKCWENKLHLKLFQIPVRKQTTLFTSVTLLVSLAGGSWGALCRQLWVF